VRHRFIVQRNSTPRKARTTATRPDTDALLASGASVPPTPPVPRVGARRAHPTVGAVACRCRPSSFLADLALHALERGGVCASLADVGAGCGTRGASASPLARRAVAAPARARPPEATVSTARGGASSRLDAAMA
jgi:hypothetical protein